MEGIILYGSKYGSARLYAQALAEQIGFPALPYREAPVLCVYGTLVYIGALYAGGVLGLRKTLRNFSPGVGQQLLLATVGIADPADPDNQANIRKSLQAQMPPAAFERAQLFHLRGRLDYPALTPAHRALLALLYRSLRRLPPEKQTAENRALIETYGKQVDFVDLHALAPLVQALETRHG